MFNDPDAQVFRCPIELKIRMDFSIEIILGVGCSRKNLEVIKKGLSLIYTDI